MTTMTAGTGAQVYRVYIKTSPERVWDAITKPEWTRQFGYGGDAEYDLRPGGQYRGMTSPEMRAFGAGDVAVDGEIIEVDPPWRLVQTWRLVMDEAMAAEGFTKLTYELKAYAEGLTRLTVTHEFENAPLHAALLSGQNDDEGNGGGGGWSWVLSGLKSLLETGEALPA